MPETDLYNSLLSSLPTSDGPKRRQLAEYIVEKDLDIRPLFDLFLAGYPVASRFQWLLSDIGLQRQSKLFDSLHDLLEFSPQMDEAYRTGFANYWLIAGLPEQDEAVALSMCFDWLNSPQVNVTIKSRAMRVLCRLIVKYPEVTNELASTLEAQLGKYTAEFDKRVKAVLQNLKIKLTR